MPAKQAAPAQPQQPKKPVVDTKPASSNKQLIGIGLIVVGVILIGYAILTW